MSIANKIEQKKKTKAQLEKRELAENMGSGIAGSSKKTSDISTETLQALLIKED